MSDRALSGPLVLALFLAAGTCVTLAIGHAFIWTQRRDDRRHLWLALAAAAAGANAIAEAFIYKAATIETYNAAFKWANTFNVAAFVFFFWFFTAYSSSDTWRRVRLGVTCVFAFAVVVNALRPYGFLFDEIESLRAVQLPWGETIVLAEGTASAWRYLTDLAFLGMIAASFGITRELWNAGRRRSATFVGSAFILYLLLALGSGFATDTGVVELPYLFTWAFLLVGLAMTYEIAVEVVRAGELSKEVQANEQRWRSLLENVQLLVAGVDREQKLSYVNPYFTEVTGFAPDEVLGTSMLDLLPSSERESAAASFEVAMRGSLAPHAEGLLRTKQDVERRIMWSRVLMRDSTGVATGLLSIGADVTERSAAEKARDDALDETRSVLEQIESLKKRLEDEVVYLSDEIRLSGHFGSIVGDSDALRYVLSKVEQVAPLDTTVLIEGETGVGKELFAREIHTRSPRAKRTLVKVNCASLPENLVESELFGHERGAFTGATRLRKGRFEVAHRGTIFLDEVGELPLELQGKLLRVLQEGEFERVGGDQTLEVDTRVIAATNRNLQTEVAEGRFREDLFYRLNVYPITVPSLRQRIDDVPLLARAFVERYARQYGKTIDNIPGPVMEELRSYGWPGNVRELENVIQRAVITTPGTSLRLAAGLRASRDTTEEPSTSQPVALSDVERLHIVKILESCSWRIEGKKGAATQLGLHPNTLRFRMKKLGIERPKAKTSS